jgi:CRISPR/Cas system-associated exonuclease Cas4 (RecB family)
MNMGTRFHRFAEIFFQYCEGIEHIYWDTLIPDGYYNPMEKNWMLWWMGQEMDRLIDYDFDYNRWKPIATEIYVEDDGLGICGTIDRVDRNDDGTVSIIEYKTGSSFYLPSLKRQLAFYSYIWTNNIGDVVDSMVVINPRLEKIETYKVTDKDINKVVEDINIMRDVIENGNYERDCTENKFRICQLCEPEDVWGKIDLKEDLNKQVTFKEV